MPVTLDTIAESPNATDEQGRVTSLTRFVDVTGLTAGTGTLVSALSASGVPQDGDAHPNDPALYVTSRSTSLLSRTAVRIELAYDFLEQVEWENDLVSVSERAIQGGASLRSVRTQFDVNNQIIKVTNQNKDGDESGYVEKLEPQRMLTIQFDEGHQFPPEVTDLWIGKLNSAEWLGDAARAWLCTGVDFDLRDDNTTPKVWSWSFEFQYSKPIPNVGGRGNFSGWDASVVATDDRGKPMANPDPGQIKDVQLYETLDFSLKFVR